MWGGGEPRMKREDKTNEIEEIFVLLYMVVIENVYNRTPLG